MVAEDWPCGSERKDRTSAVCSLLVIRKWLTIDHCNGQQYKGAGSSSQRWAKFKPANGPSSSQRMGQVQASEWAKFKPANGPSSSQRMGQVQASEWAKFKPANGPSSSQRMGPSSSQRMGQVQASEWAKFKPASGPSSSQRMDQVQASEWAKFKPANGPSSSQRMGQVQASEWPWLGRTVFKHGRSHYARKKNGRGTAPAHVLTCWSSNLADLRSILRATSEWLPLPFLARRRRLGSKIKQTKAVKFPNNDKNISNKYIDTVTRQDYHINDEELRRMYDRRMISISVCPSDSDSSLGKNLALAHWC
nr:uncharacterized protein LOC113809865 [Penaeus vannamei]